MSEPKMLLVGSFILMCVGTAFGYIVTDSLAGRKLAQEFLIPCASFVLIIFFLQIWLFFMARARLVYLLVFTSFFGLAMVWYLMCFAAPIFWLPEIGGTTKLVVFTVSAFLFVGNGFEGVHEFKRQWQKNEPDVMKHYDRSRCILDWHKVTKSLHLSISIYVPGMAKDITLLLSVPIFISMMLGFSFRKEYPIASIFAWGIPFIMISACLTQLVAIGIAQVFKVIEIEKELGVKILPKSD